MSKPTTAFTRFLFGHDIFISYSRKDCGNYAERLAIELQQEKYRCYIDRWDTRPGSELPAGLTRKLKNSSMLIILGTKESVNSSSIEKEIDVFAKTGRIIVPIDFGYLHEAKWFDRLIGLPIIIENETNRQQSRPSQEIKESIIQAFTYQKQNKKQRRAIFFTSGLLLLLITLIVLAGVTLTQLQTQRQDLLSSNSTLKLNNDSLNKSNGALFLNNKKLMSLSDSVRQELIKELAENKHLVNENAIAGRNLLKLQGDLSKTLQNLETSEARLAVNRNLADAVSADFQNSPSKSYSYAMNALNLEQQNGFNSGMSSLLISKSENRGIAQVINLPNGIDELKVFNGTIYFISRKTGTLEKLNEENRSDKKISGKFIGLDIDHKTGHLLTCEMDSLFKKVDLVELDKDLEIISRNTILSTSDWDGKVDWSDILYSEIKFYFSDFSADVCIKIVRNKGWTSNQLIYQVYYDMATKKRRKIPQVIPDPFAYDHNQNRETFFVDASRAISAFNSDLYFHDLSKGSVDLIKVYKPGFALIRGAEARPTINDFFSYDNNGLLAYENVGWIEFLTVGKNNCRFNKTFRISDYLLLNQMRFLEPNKLLVIFRDRDMNTYSMNVLQIDTLANKYSYYDQFSARVVENQNSKYYEMDHLGRFKLSQNSQPQAVLYDYQAATIMVTGYNGNVEVVDLSTNRSSVLYGIAAKPKISDYDASSKRLVMVKGDTTIEIWEMDRYLSYPVEFYGTNLQPGQIKSISNTENLSSYWRTKTIDAWQSNGNEYMARFGSTTGPAVTLYKNRELDAVLPYNPGDWINIIPVAGFISIQESLGDNWLEQGNNGKALLSHSVKNKCRLFRIGSPDSIHVYCPGQLSVQNFSTSGDWVEFNGDTPLKKKIKDLKNGDVLAGGIISADGKYYCEYQDGILKMWELGRKDYKSLRMDSLIYMEFIPGSHNLLSVSGVNSFMPCVFKTVDVERAEVINSFSVFIRGLIKLGVTDSVLYFRNSISESSTSISLYSLFSSQIKTHQLHSTWTYSDLSHNRKWVSYCSPNVMSSYAGRNLRIASLSNPDDFIDYYFPATINGLFFSEDDRYIYVDSGPSTFRLAAPK